MADLNRRRNFLAFTAAAPAAALLPSAAGAADASDKDKDRDKKDWELVIKPGLGCEDVSVDYDGRVWVVADNPSTYANGALLYSEDEGKTFKLIPTASPPSGLERVSGGNGGVVWTVANASYGSLWYYKLGDAAQVNVDENNSYGYPTGGVYWVDVAVSYDNTAWVVSSDGKLYKVTYDHHYNKFKFELVKFKYRGHDSPYFYRVAVGLDKTIYLVDKYGILYVLKRGHLVRVFLYFKVRDVAATYKEVWVCSDKGHVWNIDLKRGRIKLIRSPRHAYTDFESIAVGFEDETVWTVGKDESLWKYGDKHHDHDDDDDHYPH